MRDSLSPTSPSGAGGAGARSIAGSTSRRRSGPRLPGRSASSYSALPRLGMRPGIATEFKSSEPLGSERYCAVMGTQNLERGGLKQKRKQVMASERSRASAAPDPWPRFAVWAAPAAVALLAFVHTLPYKFVFDDEGQILRNPWIRDWSNLKTIFATDVWRFSDPTGVTNYYRPLHMLLYMLGYHVFGLEPRGYHALSILLHSLSTVLVTSIGLRLTGDRRVAV